jgi:serine phosphatase RsbU (regulator of sigma subunit)/PAS domain-containing protein
VLASSLDVAATMDQVARLLVPRLADLCTIDLLAEDGSIGGIGVASSRSGLAPDLENLRRRFPLDAAGEHPVARVIRSGEVEYRPELTSDFLRSVARSEAHARFMIDHRYHSTIVAPLVARGRILGALSVLRLGESAGYRPDDVDLVSELARRAAVAIDNATLYSRVERAEQRLDAVFASVADAITVVDVGGCVAFANQAAADLFGCERPADLAGADSGALLSRLVLRDESGGHVTLDALPDRRVLAGVEAEPLLVRSIDPASATERWLRVRSSPINDSRTGRVAFAVNVFDDITDVKRAELGEKLMAEASRLLVSSADYGETLRRVARLAVDLLADWCAIDLVEGDATERVAVAEAGDPSVPGSLAAGAHRGPIAGVIRGGQSVVATDLDRNPACGRSGHSGATAAIIVPIVGGAKIIGAVSLVSVAGGRHLGGADLALAERLARRIGTAVERSRLNAERAELARTLARALLPGALPAVEGVELDARYLAAGAMNEVGGDFYDVIPMAAGALTLVIGDVCGKGAQAAGLTALARHTLRAAAFSGQPPAAMLATLHEALRRHSASAELCTVCLVVVAPPQRRDAQITIVLAGHPPPLIVARDGGARFAGIPGTLLGIAGEVSPGLADLTLRSGDTLVLYTDGVIEAGRPDNNLGEQGLLEVAGAPPRASVSELLARIERIAVERSRGTPRDDVALLGMRLRAA